MQLVQPLISAAFAGCLLVPAPQVMRGGAQQTVHFPDPQAGIVIPAGPEAEGRQTLADLLRDFCKSAGQNVTTSPDTRQMLESQPVGLLNPVEVPADQLYSYVESLLFERGFVLTELRAGEPRLLGVHAVQSREAEMIRERCVTVAADRIHLYEQHPALMVRTVIDISPIDARQLVGAVRSLARNQNLYSVLNLGGQSAVLIEGPGAWVARMADLVREGAEIEAKWVEQQERLQAEREAARRADAKKQGDGEEDR